MARPLLNIDVDPAGAIAMLTKLGPAVERHLLAVAKETADRVKLEGRARLDRQTHGTGTTAKSITAEQAHDGKGYVVYVDTAPGVWPNLDIGLEFGTRYMSARPFLHASALLEEGPHRRRIEAAIQAAIDEVSR